MKKNSGYFGWRLGQKAVDLARNDFHPMSIWAIGSGSENKAVAAVQPAVPARWQAFCGHGSQIYPDHNVAPEVLKHENYSCKVDIWSFGMILYYMFVDVPYKGLTVEYIINDIATNKLNLNDQYLSSSLKLVFTNCVKYDPKLRWDSLILVNYCNNEIHIEDEVAVKPKYCFCI